jgi:glutathione S-transferase
VLDDAGKVICDSRRICEHLLADDKAARLLTPSPLEGPIWAYSDWCDGALEDVVFRIGSPAVRDNWKSPGERALYVFIKERKFGAGCVDQWLGQRDELVGRAQVMLAPTERTLAAQPFLFGATPTLADAALYGQFAMLHAGDPALLRRFSPVIAAWIARVEKHAPRPMRVRLAV